MNETITAFPPAAPGAPAALTPALGRLLTGASAGTEGAIANLRKGSRELSALSLNYNGHAIRAGLRSAATREIDATLEGSASTLARLLFNLQQTLLRDIQTLSRLARIEQITDLEDERPLPERIHEVLGDYTVALERNLDEARRTMADIAITLGVLANNTEITTCRMAPDTGGAGTVAATPVELFVAIAAQMRALARRLRTLADNLAVFGQTQQNNADAVRIALLPAGSRATIVPGTAMPGIRGDEEAA